MTNVAKLARSRHSTNGRISLILGKIELTIIQIADQLMNNGELKSGNSLNIKIYVNGDPTLFMKISISTLIPLITHSLPMLS